ncbi:HlyD family secretion protein [Chitinophaga arvensicola]|uniref:HlyD family secretion protein n=1 Tax=Chitinophaga arvensicola TaxID=29529 RepID=A0A1I0S8D7_9BACT|nr:HlyD family efflux transporter periplasmic adaptor subunit [Chitinophaga arvensicola]SEW52320.1 HlyD family secretion protein [Chitinophaga arvensicola]
MEKELIDKQEEKEFLAAKTITSRINQRSELSEEIISRKPDFLERWALLFFLSILLVLFFSTWFIKYPDIIETRAILTAENAPKEIVTKQDGRLVKLLIHNNDDVAQGEIIGWFESTARHEDVLFLSEQLDSSIALLNSGQISKVATLFNKRFDNLGELQSSYQKFITICQQYNDYIVMGFYERRKYFLQTDIYSLDSARQIIYGQKELTEQDVKLAEETFSMNKQLLAEKVLSNEEFRVEKSKYVNKTLALPQLETSLLSNTSLRRDKLKELDQLEQDVAIQKTGFQQSIQSLKSEVDDWKKKYFLQAPVAGKTSFIIPLQENQYLKAGKVLGYINPDDTHIYVEANLPQHNFGKIDTGFQVQLRFEAYPYQENGFVEGTLSYISSIPSDSGFLATIRLNRGLVTNNNKNIPYKNGLRTQAIIITKNLRLMERMYYNLVKSTSVGNK